MYKKFTLIETNKNIVMFNTWWINSISLCITIHNFAKNFYLVKNKTFSSLEQEAQVMPTQINSIYNIRITNKE